VGAFDKCLFSVHAPQLEKSVLEQSGHIDSNKAGFRSHDIYHYYPFKKPDPNGVVVGGESTRFGVLTDNDMRKQGYKRKVSSSSSSIYIRICICQLNFNCIVSLKN
jgi:distribution and morphology protein 31